MYMRMFTLEPHEGEGTFVFSETNRELAGAVHVNTHTEPTYGFGDDARRIVILAFYPDEPPTPTLRDLADRRG